MNGWNVEYYDAIGTVLILYTTYHVYMYNVYCIYMYDVMYDMMCTGHGGIHPFYPRVLRKPLAKPHTAHSFNAGTDDDDKQAHFTIVSVRLAPFCWQTIYNCCQCKKRTCSSI